MTSFEAFAKDMIENRIQQYILIVLFNYQYGLPLREDEIHRHLTHYGLNVTDRPVYKHLNELTKKNFIKKCRLKLNRKPGAPSYLFSLHEDVIKKYQTRDQVSGYGFSAIVVKDD